MNMKNILKMSLVLAFLFVSQACDKDKLAGLNIDKN